MPFSHAPQRYIPCKIKESDMYVFFKGHHIENMAIGKKNFDGTGNNDINIPGRVIMNNSTLTVYTGEDYDTMVITFNLQRSVFFKSFQKKNCFQINEGNLKSIILCPFDALKGRKQLEEWARDFDMFKNICKRLTQYDHNSDPFLQADIKKKMDEARQAAIDSHNRANLLNSMSQKENNFQILVKKTNNIAVEAIHREMNLEELLRQEEEEKNREEEEKIKKLIEKEKSKKECILKAINEKHRENEYSMKAMQAQQHLDEIKKEAAKQVMKRRNSLKKLIAKIREESQLKKNILKQKLLDVKASIAGALNKAYKKGNIDKCLNAMKSQGTKINYCTALFLYDFNMLDYCKKTQDFCNICCNAEFGEMYQNEKQECLVKICPKNTEELFEETTQSRWIWQNS